jgi:uncharacterized protein (DUF4213/DUF364 family)
MAQQVKECRSMKILDALLSSLNMESRVQDIRQGPFQTAVLTRGCGLASTPHYGGSHHSTAPIADAGLLLEKDAKTLVQLANSSSLHEAAIGMATLNSLINIDETRCTKLNAGDLIAEKGRDKRVAIVGHFPFIPKLRDIVKDLWVIEKHPLEGDLAETEAENFIPKADVVAITGTAFTNHTIEPLLEFCNPGAFVVILGDSSPLLPVLFDYGIDAISGTKVIDPELAMRCVSQGATFRQIRGIELLTMMKK